MTAAGDDAPRPWLALVGRPNVGKSTLFNRCLGARQAVVSPLPGTTRDHLFGTLIWQGAPLTLVDAGGLDFVPGDSLSAGVQRHVRRLFREADGFLMICDAQTGVIPADAMIVEELRKAGKPILLVANKADHRSVAPPECHDLGIPDVLPVSALHGRGIGELLDRVRDRFPAAASPPAVPEAEAAVAIVGRPNVGKSSLLNAMLRKERALVSEVPGTTRDALDTRLTVGKTAVVLIDTAGLRHRRKVRMPVDMFSMSRTLYAIQRCDVALVVLDATQSLANDDRRILTTVANAGCGLVILVNKWDLVKSGDPRRVAEMVHRALPACAFAPVLAISASTGFQVPRCLTEALRIARAMRRGLSDAECTRLLKAAWERQTPPRHRGRPIHLEAVRWVGGRPPRVEVLTRPVGWLPAPMQRYLLKRLLAHPALAGVAVRLQVLAARG